MLSIKPGFRGEIKSSKEIYVMDGHPERLMTEKTASGSKRHLETICRITDILMTDTSLQQF